MTRCASPPNLAATLAAVLVNRHQLPYSLADISGTNYRLPRLLWMDVAAKEKPMLVLWGIPTVFVMVGLFVVVGSGYWLLHNH